MKAWTLIPSVSQGGAKEGSPNLASVHATPVADCFNPITWEAGTRGLGIVLISIKNHHPVKNPTMPIITCIYGGFHHIIGALYPKQLWVILSYFLVISEREIIFLVDAQ